MRAYERLLEYVTYATQSAPDRECHPSTPGQFDLARRLVDDLKALGLTDAAMDEHAYVYAHLAAAPGCEQAAPLGLIAHMDTSDEAPGDGVAPQLHPDYDGGTVPLGTSGRFLQPEQFPDLCKCKGETLITTDGTTLLGADDKAGVAEILTAIERLQAESLPHGPLCVAFTPDEEIGEGASLFDLERFGAAFAYTVDGGDVGELEYENFNAASAVVTVRGFSVHPGEAKDVMVNAQQVAMDYHQSLPQQDRRGVHRRIDEVAQDGHVLDEDVVILAEREHARRQLDLHEHRGVVAAPRAHECLDLRGRKERIDRRHHNGQQDHQRQQREHQP